MAYNTGRSLEVLRVGNGPQDYLHVPGDAIGAAIGNTSQSVTGASSGHGLAWSPDGRFVAYVLGNVSPYVITLEVDPSTGRFLRLVTAPVGLPGAIYSVAWNPAGTYVAFASSVTPFVAVYPWTTAGYGTIVSAPAATPSGSRYCAVWSPDGAYLAIGGVTTPFMDVWPFTTGYGTRWSNPGTLSPGTVYTLAWHPNGSALVAGSDTTPFIRAWPTTTAFGTVMTDPSPPPGTIHRLRWQKDGLGVVWSGASTPYMGKFGYNAGVPQLDTPVNVAAALPTGAAYFDWDQYSSLIVTSNVLSTGAGTLGLPLRHARVTTALNDVKGENDYRMGSAIGEWYAVAISPNRKWLATVRNGFPYIGLMPWRVQVAV